MAHNERARSATATDAVADRRPREGLSHVSGARTPELRHVTVGGLLQETAAQHGEREAAVFVAAGVRWSYRDLLHEADRLAAGLLALGLEPGDRVGIWSPNRPEWLALQFATARAGLVLVTINPAYRVAELEHALNAVGCKALVLAPAFKTSRYLEMLRGLAPELERGEPGRLDAARLPHLKIAVQLGDGDEPGMFAYREVVRLGGPEQTRRLEEIARGLDPDDAINIQFTSGTSGTPKGATLSHANIVNNARFVVATMRFTPEDRLCIPVPLYHCFGMVMGSLGCVATASTMVFPGEGFEPLATLEALQSERCTALYGVPTMFVAMLEHPEFARFDLHTLRTGIMAGAPCPIEVMKRVVGEMHMPEVTIAYGMTETSPVSFQSDVDDPLERRVSTVGRVGPHLEVKVVDEEGRTVRVGEQGELCTRGYSVMRGYWGDEARTREAIDAEGWMHTGDLAILDAEGYGNIVGRVKDMIIRGGENVFPREIEEFLYRHPKVQEAQVFGVPDPRLGEEICAWIVLRPGETATEAEIRDYCRGQIAHFKIPRHVRFKTELPVTVTGKAQKFKMRQAMAEELGRSEARTA